MIARLPENLSFSGERFIEQGHPDRVDRPVPENLGPASLGIRRILPAVFRL